MYRTFNCGIGMTAIVAPDRAADLAAVLRGAGETVCEIGRIAPRGDGPAVTVEDAA
jgi:phosphoribosylaminoimidazole (AIR) synthetase